MDARCLNPIPDMKRVENPSPSRQVADAQFYRERISCIASLLESGQTAEAILLANLDKANFDQNEPRDDRGWWSKVGSTASPLLDQAQYRGGFHDLVVEDLINGLNVSGGKAIAHIPVLGINGILAIPDGASLPSGWPVPYFIEVKTGIDPPFTENQTRVYPLICIGGHALSTDQRITQLGLKPGELLPPMDILIVYTSGPGQPLTFVSYCKEIGLRGAP